MKIFILLLTVSTIFFDCSIYAKNQSKQMVHSIIISANKGLFAFGRKDAITVKYCNKDKKPWVILHPLESYMVVEIRLRLSGTKIRAGDFLGLRCTTATMPLPDGSTWIAQVAPSSKTLSIAPSKSYEFKTKIEKDYSGWVVPGYWIVYLKDHSLKQESNKIKIPLYFTADSIKACYDIAIDKKQTISKRKDHAKWLKKIKKDLNLKWWWYDTPEKQIQKLEIEIQKELHTFKKYLDDKKNAKNIKDAIELINREAGLIPTKTCSESKKNQSQNKLINHKIE